MINILGILLKRLQNKDISDGIYLEFPELKVGMLLILLRKKNRKSGFNPEFPELNEEYDGISGFRYRFTSWAFDLVSSPGYRILAYI